jgi:hypothetical protein
LERLRIALEQAEQRAERAERRAASAEVAVQQGDDEKRRYGRFRIAEGLLDTFRWTAAVAVSWIPFHALEPIARDFAGKSTHFDSTLSISVAFSVVTSVGWAITANESRLRKKKLKRQRGRFKELEQELEDLQSRFDEQEEAGAGPSRRPKQRTAIGEEP